MFAEHLELLLQLWSDGDVHWSGSFRAAFEGLSVRPQPLQRPRPPIWLGAGASATSVELAARLGLRLMLPTVFGTPEMFVPMVELYEERWEQFGHDPAERRIGCVSHAHVDTSSAAARAGWEPRYRAYIEWVNDLQTRSSEGRNRGLGGFDFERLCQRTALCGSPAEVLDRMGVIQRLLHLDTHVLMFDMGGLPDDELFATIELVGAELIPTLAAR
jgi:alkanesulfonate monooxygenase SsuD/methylene tetrahydromethanopterin reductase-like flavin-dependent oxidoreductase (luciferase family)